MKKLQKPIAIILIIGLVLSVNFNLFIFKPKKANALDGGGSWMQAIKELVLDAIGWTVSDMILKRLEAKIIAWGQGRNTDAMKPFAVSDWIQYFRDAVALGAAKYIAEYDKIWDTKDKFHQQMKDTLDSLGFSTDSEYLPTYSEYARPTLKEEMEAAGVDYDAFVNSGYSLMQGGWAGWFAQLQPQNNIFGQIMMAAQERRRMELAQKEAADKETAVSGGYRNETVTTLTDVEACKLNCGATPFPGTEEEEEYNECIRKCEMKPGIAMQTRIKNWGSTIEKSMTNALGKDMSRIISADEISELIGVIFSALMNRAIDGMGLAFSSLTGTKTQIERNQLKQTYSYQRAFKKEQTLEDIKDIRSKLLTGILKSIQQLSRSITSCDEDEMLTYQDYAKNSADILAANTEALYVGLEGVNLKPDFEVLDPRFAPYSVYGYSWGHVPAAKFPAKCKKITDQLNLGPNATCRWIRSGLEPNFDSRCEQCMYDHNALACPIGPVPPLPYPQEIPETTIEAKQDFYNACRRPYLAALNRCDDCLKKVDEKCGQLTEEEKTACIEKNCGNYGGLEVVSPPTSELDFYNKCLIEEQKEACYVCLKEYYMPATYCEQIQDYIARSTIKYPVVVHDKERNRNPWLGPYDEIKGAEGNACSDNDDRQDISLALICRILPDFKYAGEQVCKTRCNQYGMTEEQLRDITDFRPYDKDCGNQKLNIGGKETYQHINDGVLWVRGKCCAALWQHDPEKYAICVGSGPTTSIEPPPVHEDFCGDYVTNCSNYPDSWGNLEREDVEGGGAVTNLTISHQGYPFIHEIMLNRPLDYSRAAIISIRPNASGANLYVTRPYCRTPDSCCRTGPQPDGQPAAPFINGNDSSMDNFSWDACPYIEPSCMVDTNGDNIVDQSDREQGNYLRPTRVPDPNYPGDWEIRGYCTTNPLNPSDLSSYIGPLDVDGGNRIICQWRDTNNSENCINPTYQSCGELANYSGTLWLVVDNPRGGMAICGPGTR